MYKAIQREYRTNNSRLISLSELSIGTKVYICNGNWYGEIIEVNGEKAIKSNRHTGLLNENIKHEVEICDNDFNRPRDDEDYEDYEMELWQADPDCEHEIVSSSGGGVRCIKCGGWFCY